MIQKFNIGELGRIHFECLSHHRISRLTPYEAAYALLLNGYVIWLKYLKRKHLKDNCV